MDKLKEKLKGYKFYFIALMIMLIAPSAMADGVFDTLIHQYKSNTAQWYTTFYNLGKSIFWGLALIEFAWSTLIWSLEGKEVQEILGNLAKKAISIGFFWWLFTNASTFVPAIIDTFKLAGQQASGVGDISPSAVYDLGVYNGTAIMHSATVSVTDLATTLFAKFIAFFIGLFVIICYIVMAGQLVITIIEGFIAQYMGILFLGFAGSRWTTDYAQKYLGYCVATGVKLMMCYLIIGLGVATVGDVGAQLSAITQAESALDVYLTIFASSAVLCFLSWHVPNLASSMLSGTPSMTLGTALATAGSMTASAIGAGAMTMKASMGATAGATGVAKALQAGYSHANETNPNSGILANSLRGIGNAGMETARHVRDSFNNEVNSNTTGGQVADRLGARTQTARETAEAGGAYTPPPASTANNQQATNQQGANQQATATEQPGKKAESSAQAGQATQTQATQAEVTSASNAPVAPPVADTPPASTSTSTEQVAPPTRGAGVATNQASATNTGNVQQATQAQGADIYQRTMNHLDNLSNVEAPKVPNDASSGGSIDVKINHT